MVVEREARSGGSCRCAVTGGSGERREWCDASGEWRVAEPNRGELRPKRPIYLSRINSGFFVPVRPTPLLSHPCPTALH